MMIMKDKILAFLKTHPPVVQRRTHWNIANHIGERGNEEAVQEALNSLVDDKLVHHRLAKNMQYWVD